MAYGRRTLAKRRLKVGDKVKIIGLPKFSLPSGVRDELGTERLFKSMLGKIYTVRGFDECGNVELHPKIRSWVWIEPEVVKLHKRKAKTV
jgi:hypothetical protein